MEAVLLSPEAALSQQLLPYIPKDLKDTIDLTRISKNILTALGAEWSCYSKISKKITGFPGSIHHVCSGGVVYDLNVIGEGARIKTRAVILIEKPADGELKISELAEKRLVKGRQNAASIAAVSKEYAFLSTLKHPHIHSPVSRGYFRDASTHKYSALEERGQTLLRYLSVVKSRPSQRLIKCHFGYTLQIMHALIYLHDRDIVHRDVKLENILIFTNPDKKSFKATLADFDISCNEKELTDLRRALWKETRESFGWSVDELLLGEEAYDSLRGEIDEALEPSLDEYNERVKSHSNRDRPPVKIQKIRKFLTAWEEKLEQNFTIAGTDPGGDFRGNIPPEAIKYRCILKQADVFGVGTMIQDLMRHLPLDPHLSAKQIDGLRDLSIHLTHEDYRKRPTMREAATRLSAVMAS
jgi:serine/threonine protein kinase